MPELPEVEVLVRHLRPLLQEKTIRSVKVQRRRTLGSTPIGKFTTALRGARFTGISRCGKYLLFSLRRGAHGEALTLVGHLGMTGRMYLLPAATPLPKHAPVVLGLGQEKFVFEDTRYFGRLTLDTARLSNLGPEPLDDAFTAEVLFQALRHSAQPIKLKLLDQSVVGGIGNIYASEALFRAGISPKRRARNLTRTEVERLCESIKRVLLDAIERGSTVPLDYAGVGARDGLFYFGSAPGRENFYEERLRVYDRAGKPCVKCRKPIRRIVQAARSTFYCPYCQRGRTRGAKKQLMSQ